MAVDLLYYTVDAVQGDTANANRPVSDAAQHRGELMSSFTVNRAWMSDIAGGFIAFGPGLDVDQAMDAAVTSERFELGVSGMVPSLGDVNPASERSLRQSPTHHYLAVSGLHAETAVAAPGFLAAQAVYPLSAYKHERRRLVLEGTDFAVPTLPGLALPLHASLRDRVIAEIAPEEAATLVGVEVVSAPRAKFKVIAAPVKGPRVSAHAVMSGQTVLEIHPSQSLARKAAMAMARAAAGEMHLEIRPFVSRNDRDPFVRIERVMIARKVVVKAVFASLKNPEKARVAGWVFAGRLGSVEV
jgi:hypothetical protein